MKVQQNWHTETILLDRLKPALLSKLPFVYQDNKSKRQKTPNPTDIITKHIPLHVTPASSAKKPIPKTISFPKIGTVKQPKTVVDFMKIHCGGSNIDQDLLYISKKFDMESPLHITNVLPEAVGNVEQSHYNRPIYSQQYGHGNKAKRGWRQIEHQYLLWESKYSPLQIHQNFRGYNPKELCLMQMNYNERNWIQKVKEESKIDGMVYKYPNRYLERQECTIKDVPRIETEDEGSSKLDLLLKISQMNRQEKLNLKRLNTAIQCEEKAQERSKNKFSKEYLNRIRVLNAKIMLNLLKEKHPKELCPILQRVTCSTR
jgi:hypothetical protein